MAETSPYAVVSSHIHFVVEALSDPEVNASSKECTCEVTKAVIYRYWQAQVRGRSYRALRKILAANIIEDECKSSDYLDTLVDQITQEKHPSALEEVFHAITEFISNSYLEEMPLAGVAHKIIDQCSHHDVTVRFPVMQVESAFLLTSPRNPGSISTLRFEPCEYLVRPS